MTMPGRLKTLFVFVLLVACVAVATTIQHRQLKKVALSPPFHDTWSLSGRSAAVIDALALGYDLVVADFLWLRAIQSFGGRGMTNRDWRPVYDQFDTITELDPYFESAYTFGNLVIGDEGGRQREGLRLLDKGMNKMIYGYRIPFEAMYVAHWQMGDTRLARWYGRIASKRRNAPDWVPRIVAYLDVQSGQFYIGFDRFTGNLLEGLDADDAVLRRVALRKVAEAVDKWSKDQILRAYDEYTSATGQPPVTVEQLAGQPALQNYEIASMTRLLAKIEVLQRRLGRPSLLETVPEIGTIVLPTPQELAEAEAATSQTLAVKDLRSLQNEVFRYALTRRSGIPPEPFGDRYVINQTMVGYPHADRENLVVTETERRDFLKQILGALRAITAERRDELGRNPQSWREVFFTDFNTTEPYGGKWEYDPATAVIRSTSHPDL
ncbi:MAG: hypothetical protein N2111_07190 [Candidatus Sumerlaeaceae bacterium]|nr:hypothetical protein [Candidatus Sumerlaeaceae bacterium]